MPTTTTRRKPLWENWERSAWEPPPEEPIDAWAERHVVMPPGVSALPGPLDLGITPYMRGILQAYTDPEVEEITICSSTQVGKTTCGMIPVLYSVAEDPWNVLVVMPRDQDAAELNQDRYQPVIRESPELAKLLQGGSAYDCSRARIRFPSCTVSFAGAQSPAALASKAMRTLVLDEIDKWPPWSGREADPVELARERTRTFWNRKILKMSTPTVEEGYIWRELLQSTNERYWVPCPHCGEHQELLFGAAGAGPGIKWPEGATAEQIRREALAWYACAHCGLEIRDTHKGDMLRAGIWVPQGCRVSGGGVVGPSRGRKHVGFHLWAGYSPWLAFSDIAAKFLVAKGSQAKLMNFYNSWLGQPWKLVVNEVRGALVRQRQGEYEEGACPTTAWCLTAGVDVQAHQGRTYLYYVIRAWGREGESWLVKHGLAEGWEVLSQVLFKAVYRDPTGSALPLHMALVDSGDGNKTDEVYDYCVMTGCYAYKGASKPLRPIKFSTVDRLGTNINLALVDSGFFKVKLHRLIHSDKWHLPRVLSEEYFAHMVAEQLVRTRHRKTGRDVLEWKVIPEGTANHYFDAEVMAIAAAEILEVGNLAAPVETQDTPAVPEAGPWAPLGEQVIRFSDRYFS